MSFAGRHSMDSSDWYTPAPFVEAARKAMGRIDLDPASDAEANQVVQAGRFISAADDGLVAPWASRSGKAVTVFLNPPGGKTAEFWIRLAREIASGTIEQAVWIGHSLEQLQSLQSVAEECNGLHPFDLTICIPRRRIAFVENEARRAARLEKIRIENEKRKADGRKLMKEKSGPSHANFISYYGVHYDRFRMNFGQFGYVRGM